MITSGAHQTFYGGINDAFIIKFNSSGVRVWGTYYGGSGKDIAHDVVCQERKYPYIYVTGETTSTNNIHSSGAQQPYNAGGKDAFIVKFNQNGQRIWGRYFGGSADDIGLGIAAGNLYIYVTGETSSTNLLTGGSHQDQLGGGTDAFLLKLNNYGQHVECTYYGGSADDTGNDIAIYGENDLYIIGSTWSNNAIAYGNSFQNSNGGYLDAFVVKFDRYLNCQWGTFYGGNLVDEGLGIDADIDNIAICGHAGSSNYFGTSGSFMPTGNSGAFIAKFNASGSRIWGSYYGTGSVTRGTDIAINPGGNVIFSGVTNNSANIATPNAHQPTLGGSNNDAFIAKLSSDGSDRIWGTYYGGYGSESGNGIHVDPCGAIYMAGETGSNNNISSQGAHQTNIGGGIDGFFVKFCDEIDEKIVIIPSLVACGINSVELTINIDNTCYNYFQWKKQSGSLWLGIPGATGHEYTATSEGVYAVIVYNGCNYYMTDPVEVKLGNLPDVSIDCTNYPDAGIMVLTADPSGDYPPFDLLWSTGETTTSIMVPNNSTYNVTVTDNNGCTAANYVLHDCGGRYDFLENERGHTSEINSTFYPEPVHDKLMVDLNLSEKEDMEIVVYDILGKQRKRFRYQSIMAETLEIDVNDLPAGIYIVRLITDKEKVEHIFVKK